MSEYIAVMFSSPVTACPNVRPCIFNNLESYYIQLNR